MNSIILYLVYSLEINWINFIFVGLPLCSWSLGWRQELTKPRQKMSHEYKESIEAELSYVTEAYGFVDDEYSQHSGSYVDPRSGKRRYLNPVEQILQTLIAKYVNGNESYDTRIMKKYFDDPASKSRLCPIYLKDPIWRYNKIELINNHETHYSQYELKFMEFQYFTRKIESVKVINCPVVVDGFITQLYFLEVYHHFYSSGPLHAYFVFFNKVIPKISVSQPLQLLMYVYPNPGTLSDMNTEGEEAVLLDALESVSTRAVNIRLHIKRPRVPVLSARSLIDKMKDAEENYVHCFGEEAEIILLAHFYGFHDLPKNRARPWRMKKMLTTLDRMGKGYELDRKRMEAIKNIDARKSCFRFITLNDQLKKRKIVPRRPLLEAGYVRKFVEPTQFEFLANGKRRELLKCPIIFGEQKRPRTIYLLPIFYKNPAKLPQLFTFFDDTEHRQTVNVYLLSPVPRNVDDIDFTDDIDITPMDPSLINLEEVTSTPIPHYYQTSSDVDLLSTITTDLSTVSLPTGPRDSGSTSRASSSRNPRTGSAHLGTNLPSAPPLDLLTGSDYTDTTSLPSGPVDSDPASLSSGPVDPDGGPFLSHSESISERPVIFHIDGR